MGYSYTLGLNQFGDLTQDEYLSDNFRGFRPDLSKNMSEESLFVPPGGVHLPFKVDWRTKGFVSPVKDQGGHSSASSLSSVPLAHSCESRMPSYKAEALWPADYLIFIFFYWVQRFFGKGTPVKMRAIERQDSKTYARRNLGLVNFRKDVWLMIPEAFGKANSTQFLSRF